jgi:hypothetical protein
MKTLSPNCHSINILDDCGDEKGLLLHQTDRHTQIFIWKKVFEQNFFVSVSMGYFRVPYRNERLKIKRNCFMETHRQRIKCAVHHRKVMMKSGSRRALWRFRRSGQLDFNYPPPTLQKTHIPHAHSLF